MPAAWRQRSLVGYDALLASVCTSVTRDKGYKLGQSAPIRRERSTMSWKMRDSERGLNLSSVWTVTPCYILLTILPLTLTCLIQSPNHPISL